MKNLKNIYSIFQTVLALLFCLFAYFLVSSTIKNIITTVQVKKFIASATFERDFGEATKIYYVDLGLEEQSATFSSSDIVLGLEGDFFVMPETRIVDLNLVKGFIDYNFGGHAGMIVNRNGLPTLIEAMGGTLMENKVYANYGEYYDLYRPELRSVIGYRVNTSYENRQQAATFAIDQVGKEYNYFFAAHRKDKYYCTDIVSRSYWKEAGLDIRLSSNIYDSTQDISISKNVYIVFFKYIDSSGVIHVYYAK